MARLASRARACGSEPFARTAAVVVCNGLGCPSGAFVDLPSHDTNVAAARLYSSRKLCLLQRARRISLGKVGAGRGQQRRRAARVHQAGGRVFGERIVELTRGGVRIAQEQVHLVRALVDRQEPLQLFDCGRWPVVCERVHGSTDADPERLGAGNHVFRIRTAAPRRRRSGHPDVAEAAQPRERIGIGLRRFGAGGGAETRVNLPELTDSCPLRACSDRPPRCGARPGPREGRRAPASVRR